MTEKSNDQITPDVSGKSQTTGWDGLSKSKMEFCYCDAVPRKVKKSVIKALEDRNTEDARKMANLLKSIEAESQPNSAHQPRKVQL